MHSLQRESDSERGNSETFTDLVAKLRKPCRKASELEPRLATGDLQLPVHMQTLVYDRVRGETHTDHAVQRAMRERGEARHANTIGAPVDPAESRTS
jgi:hypothetical protein